MPDHPYKNQEGHAFWSTSVARTPMAEVDPVVSAKFSISNADRVVTAGSCFAQHIARKLLGSGYNFHVTETAHPVVRKPMAEKYGYGVFSARYGSIYTSRQLLQLITRATGLFEPRENVWVTEAGRFVDPFRPSVQPGGFHTQAELEMDRRQHFRAVIKAFTEMDVFIFTLGLTECWSCRTDGAVFPVCPGVIAGVHDPDRHEFINFSVEQVAADFLEFAVRLSCINPRARIILTVSPVPLVATAGREHVLVATTYSKSVLRVAAQVIEQALPQTVAYFPSYEIITGSYTRGRYFAEDLRAVTEEGVNHVMRLFFRHYGSATDVGNSPAVTVPVVDHDEEMNNLVQVQCEEEALQNDR